MQLHRCIATAPRPSSVCFADTFPGGEGIPLRRGWADRVVRPYGCSGRSEVVTTYCNCSQSLIRLLRRHLPRRGRQSAAAGTGGQSRPPLRVRWKIGGCNDALQLRPVPHPSASQTPSPEGKAICCGGDLGGQGRPPLRVRGKIGGCNDVLQLLPDPHPSASQTPSPEGKAIRCGGDGAVGDRRNGRTGVCAPTWCGGRSEVVPMY